MEFEGKRVNDWINANEIIELYQFAKTFTMYILILLKIWSRNLVLLHLLLSVMNFWLYLLQLIFVTSK